MRGRLRLLAGLVAIATMSGASAAVADEPAPGRLTGDDPAHAAGQDGSVDPAAPVPVPLPDLGITHRLADGGMNIFRMPLSELEEGYGEPHLVARLPGRGHFAYDRSRTLVGDFADVTPGDDGTADHVLWQSLSDGSIRVWVVAGGSDARPKLWHTLPRSSGWNWSYSHPMVGDVNGDGWDDVAVRHRAGANGAIIWVLLSDGQRLGAPQQWLREPASSYRFEQTRNLLADIDDDGMDDWVFIRPEPSGTARPPYTGLDMFAWLSTGSAFAPVGGDVSQPGYTVFQGWGGHGWNWSNSRQLVGEFSGDGQIDLMTIHARSGGGFNVFVHQHCSQTGACMQSPSLWATLTASGWSYTGSRQHAADVDGDGVDDLITVHRGSTGEMIWQHVSEGWGSMLDVDDSFLPPQLVVDLRRGGWSWTASRESVADTWGLLVE